MKNKGPRGVEGEFGGSTVLKLLVYFLLGCLGLFFVWKLVLEYYGNIYGFGFLGPF